MRFSLFMSLIALVMAEPALGLSQGTESGRESPPSYKATLVTSLEIPGSPALISGSGARSMTVARDFPEAGGEPVIIVSREHAVEYRLEDGSLFLRREFADWEYPQVSKRGQYIGVTCQPPGHKEDWSFRVETWDGNVVWQASGSWGPNQYRAVSDLGGAARRAAGDVWRMQICDPHGHVVYEGPPPDSLYSDATPGDFSADGLYYAETFAYRSECPFTIPGYHLVRPGGICVVFWDALSGRELWRRWFRGRFRGPVAVSARGDLVVVAPEDTLFQESDEHLASVFVFDREGNEVGRYELGCDAEAPLRCVATSVEVSDDARFVGVAGTPAFTQLIDLSHRSPDPDVLLRGRAGKDPTFGFGAEEKIYLIVNSVIYVYRKGELHPVAECPEDQDRPRGGFVGIGLLSPGRIVVSHMGLWIYDLEEVEGR